METITKGDLFAELGHLPDESSIFARQGKKKLPIEGIERESAQKLDRFLRVRDPSRPVPIHEAVITDAQRALKPMDLVHYEDDLGQLATYLVRSVPEEMCGTAVIWLHGKSGCVALCRCHPLSSPSKTD